MKKKLSVCLIGLGSIGTRHIKNMHEVANEMGIAVQLDIFRHNKISRIADIDLANLITHQFDDYSCLGHYDVIFITNPSQLHYETLIKVKDKADYFFIEKPVFTTPLNNEDLSELGDKNKYYVACPMRHTKVYKSLEKFIKENTIYSVRTICSSYLPEWRPNLDYRKLYSSSKKSGGVKLDLIHEFDYLITLFGFPSKSVLFENKFSHLEIESSDIVSFIAEYKNMMLELHLDYFGRKLQRQIELYTKNDVVCFDLANSIVRYLNSDKIIEFSEERNEWCKQEIKYFFSLILNNEKNINDIEYANKILKFITNVSDKD